LIENQIFIKEMTQNTKGALMLGAHFGPRITSYILNENGVKPNTFISGACKESNYRNEHKSWMTNTAFHHFHQEMKYILRGQEREVIRCFDRNQVVLYYNDAKMDGIPSAIPVSIHGENSSISLFGIKAAISNNVPLYYFNTLRINGGKYQLYIKRLDGFDNALEALGMYISCLEEDIIRAPFSYMYGRHFNG